MLSQIGSVWRQLRTGILVDHAHLIKDLPGAARWNSDGSAERSIGRFRFHLLSAGSAIGSPVSWSNLRCSEAKADD